MHTVETVVSFEAAHRLYDVATYSEECRDNVHGHSYKVKVVVGREELNEAGMVVDFKLLKSIIRAEIEQKYDHSCILRRIDPLAEPICANCKKVFLVDDNPTAEWMAKEFFNCIDAQLTYKDASLKVVSVSVQETENNIATYSVGGRCKCK